MRLVDTHCHLDLPEYKDDLEAVIARAAGSGVVRMVVPGINLESSRKAVKLASEHDDIYCAVGIHPHDADKYTANDISGLRELLGNKAKIVAIGEIGLDNYRHYSSPEAQRKLLSECLDLAREYERPVILHSRAAGRELLEMVRSEGMPAAGGVVHCFSEEIDVLRGFLSLGLHVSFAGYITFPGNGGAREAIEVVPMDRLLLETDAPYITPVPHRGKRNEPANVRYLVDVYAEIYGHTAFDMARITSHNANSLFGLGLEESFSIAYPIRGSLYLNITNRCTNRCSFCTRQYSDYVKGHKLALPSEPPAEEVISAMGDISGYDEIVFCGYGEPTLRLDVIKDVAAEIKKKGKKVRLNTNGEGDLINSRKIAPELKGLVDSVSISLNAPDAGTYVKLCEPVFGDGTYRAILEFADECLAEGLEVELTCVDVISEEEVGACRRIAGEHGARFRLRRMNVVG
ncbi:MAG: YchF/TatD family DNA exonuclease [Candidatus Omnitrophica bacterium]|nr:YchF/TatD family DNA exonuclease [Candidatus Omnitrophota bacterium]MDD5487640.1 YchF/TatD family DNA exonuclease [Candidatus Omnitrophota bacterium]